MFGKRRETPRSFSWAAAAFVVVVLSAGPAPTAPACPIGRGFDYLGTRVLQQAAGAPWVFATETKLVDADGAPDAYHPDDLAAGCPHDGVGLDCPPNAGYPGEAWWPDVLVRDPEAPDRAFIQKDGPTRGYFVSMTSLENVAFAGPLSSDSFVDASRVPYLVAPAPILASEGMGSIGDIGYAIDLASGRRTPFVVADEGPLEPLGEASVAFWRALIGHAPNARDGSGLSGGSIAVVVFPGSHDAADLSWPIDLQRLAYEADQQLTAFGGIERVRACARPGPGISGVEPEDVASISFAASSPEPHAAAVLLDETFPSRKKCETALGVASATSSRHLRALYHQAACVTHGSAEHLQYRVSIKWERIAL